ncbi:MAG: hypothetical protein A3K18_08180 [Lentisphaerae bacterium RIFOXYA12_64_32]|nr:MAG: hypothetical protein A3K18_08180 [Lentisphaerae bacterium RIFOXYA12_64_32]
MSDNPTATPTPVAPPSGDSPARQIGLSLLVVAICWVFLRFGSLIVSVAITHTWHADNPIVSAYSFLFRQLITTFIYPSVLNIFRPAFIPLYNEIKTQEGPDAATRFANGVIEIGMLLGVATFGFLWLCPAFTVRVMAPDFSPAQHAATITMMREMAPGVLLLLFAEMYLLVFHAEKKFAYPHGAEAVHKIGWGVGIVVAARFLGWDSAAIGATYSLACLAQLAVNAVGMYRRFGWVLRPTSGRVWASTWGRRAWILVLPLLVGILAARFRDVCTLRLQSQLDSVRFVSVEFARQLSNLPLVFLGQIVSIVMLPHLASILYENGKETHRRTIEATVEMVWVLTIPVAAVTLVMAPELTALLFINAHWSHTDFVFCAQTALAARVIALAFSFIAIENILMPGLFSIQSMWWPTIWGLVATVFQLLCLLGLARANLGKDSALLVAGVALVYPLSRVFKNAILMLVLRHKTQAFAGPQFWTFLVRMTGLTAGGFVLMYVCHKACGRALGDIPTDADVIVYKVKLALQIGVPSAIMLAGFVGMLLWCGYRERLVDLIRNLRQRKKGNVDPAAGGGVAE